MTYYITETCIDLKDKACVEVCPVDCIHPIDGEGESMVEATWVASEGVHSFRVEVDPEELFSEQDETNNAKPLALTVEAAAEEVEDFPWLMAFVVAMLLLTIAYFALRLRR